ncbi:MAG: respiratory chain complex I subunit 1 family protein [Thermoplasmata archaeon]|nr:respiratory chain complex I subunit 1 family protein [Thermoplasmata archaeon]
MSVEFILYCLMNLGLVIVLAPLFISLIKIVKASAQGRKGPSVFQTYRNLMKLFKKEVIYSSNSSWIMRITPYVNIICMLVAALFVPLVFIPGPQSWFGNVILFLYIFALARFFMALAGLDAGSTFGGMGSSREMSLSSLTEPAMILVFAALAFVYQATNLFDIFITLSESPLMAFNPSLMLLAISLFIILIAETARIPLDNPETHLELTMVHEAMILEQSGRNLALMEMSAAVKQLLLMSVLINIFFPWGNTTSFTIPAIAGSLVLFLVKCILLALVIGLFESSLAKMRLFRLPNLLIIASVLAFLTVILEVFLP